jgi:hypothetical protein
VNQRAADADVRSAIPSAEAYWTDCNTYSNVAAGPTGCDNQLAHNFTTAFLQTTYDAGLKLTDAFPSVTAATINGHAFTVGGSYCLDMNNNGKWSHVIRPAVSTSAGATAEELGNVVSGSCKPVSGGPARSAYAGAF